MAAVDVRNVKKEYSIGKVSVMALKGVSLQIDSGEFVTVAGASGSGKSTLLNLIGSLDQPTEGQVLIEGTLVNHLSEKALNQLRLNTIGFIFQSFNLIPVLNIYENIELPLLIMKGLNAEERRARVRYFMEAVGLDKQEKHKPAELSGGQRQRVAVARALATRPKIVLADEPTANLDTKSGIEIIDLMHDICRKEGTTFIFSSHDPKVIQRADRILHLEDGLVIREERK